MKPNNYDLAFPSEIPESYEAAYGLTKLELISAMCLKGLLAGKHLIEGRESRSSFAIGEAKELLKQLEAECGQE